MALGEAQKVIDIVARRTAGGVNADDDPQPAVRVIGEIALDPVRVRASSADTTPKMLEAERAAASNGSAVGYVAWPAVTRGSGQTKGICGSIEEDTVDCSC